MGIIFLVEGKDGDAEECSVSWVLSGVLVGDVRF